MKGVTERSIFRWTHLIFAIPIVGYIYSPFADLPSYAPITRYVAFPLSLLSGLWMYAGVIFAILGVVVFLGANYLFGVGTAILSVVVLLIARKVWLVVRARHSK